MGQLNRVTFDANDKTRQVGLGRLPAAGLGQGQDFVQAILGAQNCPIWNMPVIESMKWNIPGPQLDATINELFGAKIDLFGSGENPGGNIVGTTTMAQPGQLQVYTLAMAIGFHIEPEPQVWTQLGNAITKQAALATRPISADAWTRADLVNGALGGAPFNTISPQAIFPAVAEWGWWAQNFAWHLCRGYNIRWKVGQHTNIMDELLRYTAYQPTAGQQGSSSSSQEDTVFAFRRINDYYDSLGAQFQLLPVKFRRIDSVTISGNNIGVFHPTRDFDRVDATYGGMNLRNLLGGNSEFRKLMIPYIIKPGVPIGLSLYATDSLEQQLMQRYLSITYGFQGNFPPIVAADVAFTTGLSGTNGMGTSATPVGTEQTLDATPVNAFQVMEDDGVPFKGGEVLLTQSIKGFEVTEDWAQCIISNPDLKAMIQAQTGVTFA